MYAIYEIGRGDYNKRMDNKLGLLVYGNYRICGGFGYIGS